MTDRPIDAIGVGSPITDLLVEVPDDLLARVPGEKGGMELVDEKQMASLLSLVGGSPVRAAGGSAGNTTFALARLGARTAFCGKLGADVNGEAYRAAFRDLGGDDTRFKGHDALPSAVCLSLVTPDAERTLRTCLGAAMTLSPDEVTPADFAGCRIAHIEGYLLFNRDLMVAVLAAAKTAGCAVSLDLGSFEVVRAAADILPDLLRDSVDIVYANEEESEAFCGDPDPRAGLEALGALCEVAAVKIGKDGAWIRGPEGVVRVDPIAGVKAVDATGAGDFWAAGFLYGHLRGLSPAASGKIGSLLGAEVVRQMGADLPGPRWDAVRAAVGEIR